MEYIAAHYRENLTLEVLAKHIHMNPFYFSSYFKKQVGQNFKDYLNRVRMTDGEGNMLMNAFDSLRAYVAEIRLPAYETETVEVEDEETAAADTTPADEQDAAAQAGVTEEAHDTEAGAQGETQKKTVTRRLPLDMSKVELDLFAIDGIYINQLDGEF